jgi:hypothetical protein
MLTERVFVVHVWVPFPFNRFNLAFNHRHHRFTAMEAASHPTASAEKAARSRDLASFAPAQP